MGRRGPLTAQGTLSRVRNRIVSAATRSEWEQMGRVTMLAHAEASRVTSSRLRLLGRFELTYRNESLALPMAAQRVIAFLALQCYPLQRRYVAGKLWFETSGCDPQACLRSALWRIHCCCPDARLLEATRTQLRLASDVSVDVQEQVLVARRLFDRSTWLEDSVDHRAVLEGELLPDWPDEWILLERERLHQIRLHALEALAERRAEARRFGEAVEAVFAVLGVDPLRESAHRVLIETYLAEGNRAEAIRQYQTYRSLLKRRLDLEPAAELVALMHDLQPPTRTAANQ